MSNKKPKVRDLNGELEGQRKTIRVLSGDLEKAHNAVRKLSVQLAAEQIKNQTLMIIIKEAMQGGKQADGGDVNSPLPSGKDGGNL